MMTEFSQRKLIFALQGDAVHPAVPVPAADVAAAAAGRKIPANRVGVRIAPSMRFDCPGGHLQFYPSDGRITATCTNPTHGTCVLTRFNRVKSRMGGRPCGMMVAWLAASAMCELRRDHWDCVPELEADLDYRTAQRFWMIAQPGGREFLAAERDSDAGVELEPVRA